MVASVKGRNAGPPIPILHTLTPRLELPGADGRGKEVMAHLESKGHRSGGMVVWIVERNRLEFTEDEFREMISGIQTHGLFTYLEHERPALKSQLLSMGKTFPHLEGLDVLTQNTEIEFLFEQALLHLNLRLQ